MGNMVHSLSDNRVPFADKRCAYLVFYLASYRTLGGLVFFVFLSSLAVWIQQFQNRHLAAGDLLDL